MFDVDHFNEASLLFRIFNPVYKRYTHCLALRLNKRLSADFHYKTLSVSLKNISSQNNLSKLTIRPGS